MPVGDFNFDIRLKEALQARCYDLNIIRILPSANVLRFGVTSASCPGPS